ncbi:ankyrin repeat domain-containing protein [Bradyrhizobium sp. 177]|uniref:ankyrin repeat domain-containing protein n=1 Tax=Bradyrhizobium sp. 177 TaxID=2782647 RepID=UPI001FFA20C4|nr:ankyrin repeat domain-containing protein [Bradyrhizobium sp. 177]MCK1552317.1 ankyrin repeat domain-containing protein [Bradyrhizobium sp. 177]
MQGSTEQTREVVDRFYSAIGQGDGRAIIDCLDPNIIFDLPKNEHNSIIPYLGVRSGHSEVSDAFRIRAETTEVLAYEVRGKITEGENACVVVYTKARCRGTRQIFEVEDIHKLIINNAGKIAHWKVFFDPNTEVAAFRAGMEQRLLDAVEHGNVAQVAELLTQGADPNARKEGVTALMLAAGRGNAALANSLIGYRADILAVEPRAGNSVLHFACQGGSSELVKLLLEHGAFVNSVCPATGHTPLMDALWYKWPEIVKILLDHNAALNLNTHYGFSLAQHLAYEKQVNKFGKDRFDEAERLVAERAKRDEEALRAQHLMAATLRGDLTSVKALIATGAQVDSIYPILNGFNDGHTPLLVACRDGHYDIAGELLSHGADVNAVEPTFGAVPLHKAVYNGHADITKLLVGQGGVDLNYRGATNGYTPLHDALWHGYRDCAEVLLNAKARLDIRGNDGKLPLDIAIEAFGRDDPLVKRLPGSDAN